MTFSELLAAAEAGAAKVYHAVLATGATVLSWESDPAVAPLIQAGVGVANDMLARTGTSGSVIASDVGVALKKMAALDPTVPSQPISALVGLAGAVVTDIAPGTAGAVSSIETATAVGEALAHVAVPEAAAPAPAAEAPATPANPPG